MKEFVEAGQIVNTHGIAGEVKIQVWLDSPAFLKKFPRLYLDGQERRIRSARVHKEFLIAALEGVEDLNTAMTLKGKTVLVRREDARLRPGQFFVQDILGFTVRDEAGNTVGRLTEVMETPANTVYIVTGETEHLIPAVPEFILAIDGEREEITVHLIEGM